HQHSRPAVALGILLAEGTHRAQLQADADAAGSTRVHPHSRADAPEAGESLAQVLAARRGRVPGLPRLRALAPASRLHVVLAMRTSAARLGESEERSPSVK